jgi:hypothetical protein
MTCQDRYDKVLARLLTEQQLQVHCLPHRFPPASNPLLCRLTLQEGRLLAEQSTG